MVRGLFFYGFDFFERGLSGFLCTLINFRAPTVTKGFWQACLDVVGVHHAYVVAPVQQGWPMKATQDHSVDVISPAQLAWALAR